MIIHLLEKEKKFVRSHPGNLDNDMDKLNQSYQKLLSTPEFHEFENDVKNFWKNAMGYVDMDKVSEEDSRDKTLPVDVNFTTRDIDCFKYTEVLLRSYRVLSEHVKNPSYQVLNNTESRGKIIIDQIDNALDEYRAYCCRYTGENSHESSHIRRYHFLMTFYIYPPYVTVSEMTKLFGRCFNHDLSIGTLELASILFDLDFPNTTKSFTPRTYTPLLWEGSFGNYGDYTHQRAYLI